MIKTIVNNEEKEIEQIRLNNNKYVDYIDEKIGGGNEYEGNLPINIKFIGKGLQNYKIYGNTVNGESVGDLVENGEHAGKYCVPVTINSNTTSIYFPYQIRKVGDEAEYIDYREQKQHRVRKNLLQNTATSRTVNGVTFTVNDDGSVTCNGASNQVAYIYLCMDFIPEEGITYLYSGCPQNGNITSYELDLLNSSGIIKQDIGNGITFDSTSRDEYLRVRLRIGTGYTCDNLTFYPMIRRADIADDKYEPYIENTELDITIPALPTLSGTNTLSVETTVQPSKVYIKENIDYKRIFIATRSIENNFDNPYTFKSIDSENSTLKNYRIYGNTVDGESVGDLVESGEHTGEYLVPLTVTNGTDIKSTNIYLPEQLEKCGKEVDFINYETQTLQKRKVIYGWHVDPSISDSSNSVTYLEDAIGLTPAAMGTTSFNYGSWENVFFMPKPCMLKSNGIVDYYLDPNDYSKKLDGTPSDISNSNYDGNAMMEWSKIWYKFVGGEIEGEGSFFVSSYKVDDTYHCWCNIDSQNNETEHFYTAIYNGTGTTKIRSISGITLTSANGNGSTNVSQETTRAMANNTTSDVEWYIDTYCDRILINALLVLMGKSLDTQAVYGRGIISGGQEIKEAYTTGTLNDKGLFWGDISNNNSAVKVFGMENWWGCVWRRTAGCVSVNGTMKIKLTYGTFDGSSVTGYNTSGNGYINNGTLPSTNSYIRKMHYNEFGYIPCDVTEGSSSTYYADYQYINTSETMYSLFGGFASVDFIAGAFSVHLGYNSNPATWIAAALSCKPLAGKNPETNLKNISLPALPTPSGTNTLSVETTVKPSKMYIKGHIKEITS